MGEEGDASNVAGSSGIIKFKDNFVKITKDHKRTIFIVSKSLELIFLFIAEVAESYKSFGRHDGYSTVPEYKDFQRHTEVYFRVVCTAYDGIFIFNLLLLIIFLMGEQLGKKLLCCFAWIAAIFCLAAGIILLVDDGDSNRVANINGTTELLVSGIFAIFAALTFAVESILTFIYAQ